MGHALPMLWSDFSEANPVRTVTVRGECHSAMQAVDGEVGMVRLPRTGKPVKRVFLKSYTKQKRQLSSSHFIESLPRKNR
jgi:predicted ATP-grasp superfamily ATP-dependent carboligase